MRPLLLLAGVAIALLGAAMAGPGVQTLIDQCALMAGISSAADVAAEQQAQQNVMARSNRLMEAAQALDAVAKGHALPTAPSPDADNGLHAYLKLAAQLPPTKPSPATRPAEDPSLAEHVHALSSAPPVRLYASRYRQLAWAGFETTGLPLRQLAQDANNWTLMRYGASYRPALRKVAGGLLAQAKIWRQSGRASDAAAADEAVLRLMLDVAEDSPRPDVLLLAAAYIPQALQGLSEEAAGANLSPDIVQRCIAEKTRVQGFRQAWHKGGDEANILPRSGEPTLARHSHDRALGALIACAFVIGVWGVLAILCVLLALPAAIGWERGAELCWRWNGWGRLAAVGIVVGLTLVAILVFLYVPLAYTWLLTMGSAWPYVGAMLTVPVLVGLASWTCICLPGGYATLLPTRKAVIIMAAICALVLVVLAWLPTSQRLGHAPAGVLKFRLIGGVVALEAFALLVVWLATGAIRRWRLKLRRGPRALAGLAVCVWSWVAMTVIGLVVLQVNAHRDLAHEAAFTAAAADPVNDRLGPNWRTDYFQGSRDLLSHLHQH